MKRNKAITPEHVRYIKIMADFLDDLFMCFVKLYM